MNRAYERGFTDKLAEKKAERLYTYLPKNNTALTDGLLSTALSPNGWEKYKGRTDRNTQDAVLKVLDSWEPEWTRSKALSALTQPIPDDATEDLVEFAKNHELYSFDIKDLIKAKILTHLRRTRKGRGTDPVNEVKNEKLNWHRKKKHLLFQGMPHYMVETKDGKIPPELIRLEKKAMCKKASLYKIALILLSLNKSAQAFSQDGKTVTLAKGQTPTYVVQSWNKANPAKKITVPQFLQANGNLPATKYRYGKAYSMPTVATGPTVKPVTPAAKPATAPKPAPKPAPQPVATNAVAQATGPVGFRNNNPLNLKSDGKTRWNGSTGVPAEGEFLEFNDYSSGIRAGARTLYNYGKLHNINTVAGVLDRFAPVKDNNKNNSNYASHIQTHTGIAPDQKINLMDEAILQKLVPAMGSFEIGPKLFNAYNTTSISNAVHSAIPPTTPKAK